MKNAFVPLMILGLGSFLLLCVFRNGYPFTSEQHVRCEFIRHHHCHKDVVVPDANEFDGVTNSIVYRHGWNAYQCDGLDGWVNIPFTGEQP